MTAQNFEAKALEFGQTKEATNFGFTPKNQLMEELQDPVFKAQKGALTEPIQSQTGWHIFFVKDIKPAQTADMATVKEDIKKALITNQAYDKLTEVTRTLEDLLGSGKTLSDAAKEMNIAITDVDFIDIAGVNKKGEKNNTVTPELMQEVFTLNTGDTTTLIENNNGYLLAEITDVEPVGAKPFDEVKDEVVALFVSEKQKEKFETVVNDLHEKVKQGQSLEKLATELNAQFIQENKLVRTTENPTFKILVNALFNQDAGVENAKVTMAPNNQGAVISIVHAIHQPSDEISEEQLKVSKIKEEQFHANSLNEALYSDYAIRLDVKPNMKALNQIKSMYQGQE